MNRNPYTSSEVKNLVKYIAKCHPEVKGRLGNQLYKNLVENPQKWPWGSGHSWQSWREHYKKNQAELDRKIRVYQKEMAQIGRAEGNPPTQARKGEEVSEPQQQRRDQLRAVSNSKMASKAILGDPSRSQNTPPDPSQQGGTRKTEHKAEHTNQHHTPSKYSGPINVNRESHKVDGPEEQGNNVADDLAAVRVKPESIAHEPTVPVINTLAEVVDLTDENQAKEDLMRELFGSFCEEDEEEAQESDQLEKSSQPDTSKSVKPKGPANERQYVAGTPEPAQKPSRRPSVTDASAQDPGVQPLPVAKQKAKPKLRKLVSPDPFETQPSSPPRVHPQATLTAKNTLPVLVTEGFRTTLKRPRRSSTGNEGSPIWPLKRAKKDPLDAPWMDIDKPKYTNERAPVSPTKQIKQVASRRPVQVNALASSSTSRLPVDSHVPTPAKRSPSDTMLIAPAPKRAAPLIPPTSPAFSPPETLLLDGDPFMGRTSSNTKGKARAPLVINSNPPLRIDLHRQRLQRGLTNTSGSGSTDRGSRGGSLAPSSSSKLSKQGMSRPSLVNTTEFLEIARQETAKKLALMAAERGIDFEFAHETYVRVKTLEDTEFILQKVYERDLQKRVPRRISLASRVLQRTTATVHKEAAEKAENESSDSVPNGLVRRQLSATTSLAHDQPKKHSRPRRSRNGRPSLVIRPIPPGDDSYYLSDYSPPNKTRAGQFARLEKQGRFSEAIEREKRRVSGFHVVETQVPVQREPSPSLPASKGLQSPRWLYNGALMEVDDDQGGNTDVQEEFKRQEAELDAYIMKDDVYLGDNASVQDEVVDQEVAEDEASEDGEHDNGSAAESLSNCAGDEDDDMDIPEQEASHEADDESGDQYERDDRNSSPPSTPSTIKRPSGGRERDPVFLAESEEHHRLALSVNEENSNVMQLFEETHKPNLLRLWSIKWMQELREIYTNPSVGHGMMEPSP